MFDAEGGGPYKGHEGESCRADDISVSKKGNIICSWLLLRSMLQINAEITSKKYYHNNANMNPA